MFEVSTKIDSFLTRLIRVPGVRRMWARFPIGPVAMRVKYDAWDRPNYAYGVYFAADLAVRLGLKGISVIEFGVAGGNGLIALERIALSVKNDLGINISVFGFDSGEGMPAPRDFRDLPYIWSEGFYRMNRRELEAKLSGAKLVIGSVEDTVMSFVPPYPVGFIAFDLDYYSSTKSAFRVFKEDHLPRIYCYFDDTIYPEAACHNEYIGELCAIREYNATSADAKLCPLHGLRSMQPRQSGWNDQMYVLHDFRHPLYCVNVTPKEHGQIPLYSKS
jgi:hypothetical protein